MDRFSIGHELELRIYRFDDLPNFKTKALDDENSCFWDSVKKVKLESGDSGRLAIYNEKFKKIRVYNLDNGDDVEIQVDLSSFLKYFSTIVMLGFFMDNIILVQLDHQENEFNFIIVTVVGDVVDVVICIICDLNTGC